MSAILLFMAVIAVIVGWWLSQQRLTAKPWLEEGRDRVDFPGTGAMTLPAAKIGLGVFLAVVGSLFALFISAYSMRMNMVDWRRDARARAAVVQHGVLIVSSVALQWAHVAARRDDMDGVIVGLCAGGGIRRYIPGRATAGVAAAERPRAISWRPTRPIPSST